MTKHRRIVLGSLLIALAAGGASRPSHRSVPKPEEPTIIQVSATDDVDVLAVWIDAARETFQRVRDYQCTLVKRERIDGVLQEEQTAVLRVRTQPFSVHLKFVAPKSAVGREAIYVAGRNNGKMRAKGGGALNLVGFVNLDPHDPRAMHGTRHSITEVGIGYMLERLALARGAGRSLAPVSVGDAVFHNRPCARVEVIDPSADGVRVPYRSVIYFDKDTNLPIRYEAYDRPKAGNPSGDLIESCSYLDCRFNLNLTDAAFAN
jgi:hypothetical protein